MMMAFWHHDIITTYFGKLNYMSSFIISAPASWICPAPSLVRVYLSHSMAACQESGAKP
jgi:hypothetical protein